MGDAISDGASRFPKVRNEKPVITADVDARPDPRGARGGRLVVHKINILRRVYFHSPNASVIRRIRLQPHHYSTNPLPIHLM